MIRIKSKFPPGNKLTRAQRKSHGPKIQSIKNSRTCNEKYFHQEKKKLEDNEPLK